MVVEVDAVVPTDLGELHAVIRIADADRPLPGVVLVDGSGDGARDEWGGWPEWIADAGAVVLRHDKPGCGGSPGHWTAQSIDDRARESLAALDVLRRHPAVAGQPVGFYGVSQGGWVALLAAATSDEVGFVISHSGPGVSPAVQERGRLETELRVLGLESADLDEAMGWVDERAERLRRGEPVESILARQAELSDRGWHSTVAFAYDDPAKLAFIGRILDFDPVSVLRSVTCPTLAMFGGGDTQVDAWESAELFARHLPRSVANGLVVFPHADHGLFIAERHPDVARKTQLAPGYLAILESFLAAQTR